MSKQILGAQLILDFENISPQMLSSPNPLTLEFHLLFSQTKDLIIDVQISNQKDTISFIYLFSDYSFICHAFKSSNILSFDISFHHLIEQYAKKLNLFEEKLSELFNWSQCVTSISLKRTSQSQFYLNDSLQIGQIFKNLRLLERVKSDYQDIRVFETELMGKIMVLDNNVQITNELDDNYTLDMIRLVIDPKQEYENILILGAGDLVIPSHLIAIYKNIKRLTVVEIDEKVCQIIAKYFSFSQILQKEDASKIFSLKIEDGGEFVKTAKINKEVYDGVIIDCTDVDVEGAVALSLFNVPFYKNLRDIMKEGAVFSQQITDSDSKKKFEKMIEEAGFVNPQFIYSETPEYSVCLPIGIVRK